jgi:Protein of unknown function (DUF3152)
VRSRARSVIKAAAFVSLAAVAFFAGTGSSQSPDEASERVSTSSATATTVSPPTTAPTTTTEPDQSAIGPTGEFRIVAGSTAPMGGGRLVTYRIELESGLTLADAVVAARVDAALSDPRSWTAAGDVALQRVDGDATVVIRLATPATVDRLCLPLRTNGIFSCHSNGAVNLNVVRWQQGAEGWPLPMSEYRAYMVNHEFGHAIGHGHVGCPGIGAVAPVMMQQTKGLDGCTPNAWPYP